MLDTSTPLELMLLLVLHLDPHTDTSIAIPTRNYLTLFIPEPGRWMRRPLRPPPHHRLQRPQVADPFLRTSQPRLESVPALHDLLSVGDCVNDVNGILTDVVYIRCTVNHFRRTSMHSLMRWPLPAAAACRIRHVVARCIRE